MGKRLELLQSIIDPRSIAVLGASDNRNKPGGRPVHFLKKFGFGGAVYPVNPNRPEVQGYRAYPHLDAIGETPDMAIIALPEAATPQAVRDCAARGVKCAVVITSGFAETGAEGRRVQDAMVATARDAGMRLVGPNSQGLANFRTGAVANFSTMFMEVPPADGPVAIVSQSGGASVMPYALLRERGIGVRYVHASGNDADVTVSELALAVACDPGIRLILVYAENIRHPEALAEAAALAHARGAAVVALKAGHSASGMAAAHSHTGALANEDRIVDAFFAKHGIARARDVHGLVNAAELHLKGWKAAGNRLVAISNSGAFCVMAADGAEALGLELARLSDRTTERLRAVLPGFASGRNPVDLTAALLGRSGMFGQVLPILADDPAADLFVLGLPVAGEGYDVPQFARDAAAFTGATGKPLVVTGPQSAVMAEFRAHGLPTFTNDSDALQALAQLAATAPRAPAPAAKRSVAPFDIPASTSRFLSEAQSLRLLEAAGLPVSGHRLCSTEAEAVAAFEAFGGAVAVKACSEALPHKTDFGLVRLGIDTEAGVREAFRGCVEGMQRLAVPAEGVIVARM
ncbi:MAG TPA: CoA-binding protein, partial [Usitatibacter sp.]|nr:CoA-binding protein [Usitatibacter sp.]